MDKHPGLLTYGQRSEQKAHAGTVLCSPNEPGDDVDVRDRLTWPGGGGSSVPVQSCHRGWGSASRIGLGILCKTVRRWMLKFGPMIVRGPFGSI
jgi:hypothetical protein